MRTTAVVASRLLPVGFGFFKLYFNAIFFFFITLCFFFSPSLIVPLCRRAFSTMRTNDIIKVFVS